MSTMHVHWRHEAFSRDAGMRTNDDAAGTNVDSARTGTLSDEHDSLTDRTAVLIEDESGRVYRSSDLPPGTRLVVSDVADPHPELVDLAKRAGFNVTHQPRT